MKIIIIFPPKFFSPEHLRKLRKYELQFIEGKNIDLEKVEDLYRGEELILAIDPTFVKNNWDCLNNELLAKMKGVKAICLTTTSYSWVDLKKAKELGIIITNTPGKSTEAVAEFNIYMMYSLLRKLPLIVKNNWEMDYDKFLNGEAKGLTAGIIGLGKIGSRVAEFCAGNGMKVCYWNRTKKNTPWESVTVEQLFKKSDVVFNTIATDPELKGFLNKNLISFLKKEAIIVSTSDTHIFDTEFILKQVEKGKLGGFAFESMEKKTSNFKGNIMVFPEQAYYTLGTLQNTARIVTETILSVINGKKINIVN